MTRTGILGVCFILAGAAALSIVNLVEFFGPGRPVHIGWMQLFASVPAIVTICVGVLLTRDKQRHPSAAHSRFILAVGGASCVCAAALALISLNLLPWDKGRHFEYDLTTGLDKAFKRVVRVAGWTSTRICRCAPDKTARITLPGGFETQVSIYDRGGPKPRPGVVVAHGNVWMGSDLSTYRLLGSRLSRLGLIVLTVDLPGFGKSDDPFGRGPAFVDHAMDTPAILATAVDYLIANTDVDRSNIVVFGHSGGVEPAMQLAVINPNVSKVAAMVAPPPADAQAMADGATEYAADRSRYFAQRYREQYRFVYGRSVPEWNRSSRREGKYDENVWLAYERPGHKPFLLILGERDEPSGHESVLADFASVAAPKEFTMLRRSDHYLNTAQSSGFVFYDLDVADQVTEDLAVWISGEPRSGSRSPSS